jgi:nitrogen fixation protein FixH
MTERVLTGPKVFVIVASAFTVIIGVNLIMAFKAVSTFPGLDTRNSYVASQKFDAQRKAQVGLGWNVSAAFDADTLTVSINDENGFPVKLASIDATIGRATHGREDRPVVLAFDGTNYVAPAQLARGNWHLRMETQAPDGTTFRQRLLLYVKK